MNNADDGSNDQGLSGNRPFDILLDVTPYEDLSIPLLQYLIRQGDPAAAEELDRRLAEQVWGPQINDTSPVAQRSDDVLLRQIAAGVEGAADEYLRRRS